MKDMISLAQAEQSGFVFPGARGWMHGDKAKLARDAALITSPNSTVPAELLAYIDPQVVEILTAPRRAREIFTEQKKGDWTTPYSKWRMDELTGTTQPYSDFANGTTSGVNANWAVREQYVFQTSIVYGDLEVAMSGAAKMDLVSAKQRAAATVLDIDANRFALLGVAGKSVYGILNDPNLPAAITAATTGASNSTYWNDKTMTAIYDDVLLLFAELVSQSQGLITQDSALKLCLSPSMAVRLGSASDFGKTAYDLVKSYFPNLTLVTVPELYSASSGDTALMLAEEVNGTPTGFIGFGVKMAAQRIVPDMSSFRQKFISSTYGGVVLQPFAIAQMTGLSAGA